MVKKIINQFEEFKISNSAISKLAEINDRILPIFGPTTDDPQKVALEIRKFLYPEFQDGRETFKVINFKICRKKYFSFEFIKLGIKRKGNIDGFYLNPNVIVLKDSPTPLASRIL